MQLLMEINKKDSGNKKITKTRNAVRVVLFDKKKQMPLLFVSKRNYHKLPGGGIDKSESKIEALNRELMEEVGAKIKITGEVGKIIEYKTQLNVKQISHCYMGKILAKGEPSFTEKELREGFQVQWVTIEQAISKIKKDKTENYEGKFIQKRDIEFLKKASELIKTGDCL